MLGNPWKCVVKTPGSPLACVLCRRRWWTRLCRRWRENHWATCSTSSPRNSSDFRSGSLSLSFSSLYHLSISLSLSFSFFLSLSLSFSLSLSVCLSLSLSQLSGSSNDTRRCQLMCVLRVFWKSHIQRKLLRGEANNKKLSPQLCKGEISPNITGPLTQSQDCTSC